MKMMKTEMEFVTFDAQDVITTSGGPNRDSYIIPGNLGTYNGISQTGVPIWDEILVDGNVLQLYVVDADAPHNLDQYTFYQAWQLVPYQDSQIISGGTSYVYAEQTSTPQGDQITTWQGIVDWINAYKQ